MLSDFVLTESQVKRFQMKGVAVTSRRAGEDLILRDGDGG